VCGAAGAAAGWGRPQPRVLTDTLLQTKKSKFLEFVRLPLLLPQNTALDAALLRLSQMALESEQNFARTKILPKNRYF